MLPVKCAPGWTAASLAVGLLILDTQFLDWVNVANAGLRVTRACCITCILKDTIIYTNSGNEKCGWNSGSQTRPSSPTVYQTFLPYTADCLLKPRNTSEPGITGKQAAQWCPRAEFGNLWARGWWCRNETTGAQLGVFTMMYLGHILFSKAYTVSQRTSLYLLTGPETWSCVCDGWLHRGRRGVRVACGSWCLLNK